MARRIALAACVLVAIHCARFVDAVPRSELLGVRAAIAPSGLTRVAASALPYVLKEIGTISLPDVTVDGALNTRVSLKNVKCSGLEVSDLAFSLVSQTTSDSVNVFVGGVGAKCTGDWDLKGLLFHYTGTLDATIGGATSMNGTMALSRPFDGTQHHTSVAVESCAGEVDVTKLHFSGKLMAKILDLLKGIVEKEIRKHVGSSLCSAASNFVAKKLDKILASQSPYDDVLCSVSSQVNAIVCDLNIAFGTSEDIDAGSLPFSPPAHALVPSKSLLLDNDVQILLGTYAPNFLLWYAWNMQLVDVYVTSSMIPPEVASIVSLNTSTFKSIAPGMYSKWPNSEMQIEVNATTAPTLKYTAYKGATYGALRMVAPIMWRWQVTDPNDGVVAAFVTDCDLNATIGIQNFTENAKSGNGTLSLNVEDLECTMKLSSSVVGQVETTSLNSLFALLLGAVLKPKVNDMLKGGISIPLTYGPVTLQDASISLGSQTGSVDYISAAANIVIGTQAANTVHDTKPVATSRRLGTQKISSKNLWERRRLYVPQTTPYGAQAGGKTIKITDFGAEPGKYSAYKSNLVAITKAFEAAGVGDTVVVPGGLGDFYFLGGIIVENKTDVTFQIDGMLRAVPDFDAWAVGYENDHQYNHVIVFQGCKGVTITSSVGGLSGFDGQGKKWWNEYTIGKSGHGKKRPKMLVFKESENILVEKIHLINSPSFNLLLSDVLHAEVRFVRIDTDKAMRGEETPRVSDSRSIKTSWLQFEDLNTDGVDPQGVDIWVHDCYIRNDDDSIAVKPTDSTSGLYGPCTENILIEDTTLIGVGASIGSVPPHADHNCVRNVTFRNISMPNTGKGVYIKSNPSCGREGNVTGEISGITYEDIRIDNPLWWPIWIGPQQQHEPNWTPAQAAADCSLTYPLNPNCPTQGCVTFANITLKDILITNPVMSPGVVLGNATNPMKNIVFDNVKVQNPGTFPFLKTYRCAHANIIEKNGVSPSLLAACL